MLVINFFWREKGKMEQNRKGHEQSRGKRREGKEENKRIENYRKKKETNGILRVSNLDNKKKRKKREKTELTKKKPQNILY